MNDEVAQIITQKERELEKLTQKLSQTEERKKDAGQLRQSTKLPWRNQRMLPYGQGVLKEELIRPWSG